MRATITRILTLGDQLRVGCRFSNPKFQCTQHVGECVVIRGISSAFSDVGDTRIESNRNI